MFLDLLILFLLCPSFHHEIFPIEDDFTDEEDDTENLEPIGPTQMDAKSNDFDVELSPYFPVKANTLVNITIKPNDESIFDNINEFLIYYEEDIVYKLNLYEDNLVKWSRTSDFMIDNHWRTEGMVVILEIQAKPRYHGNKMEISFIKKDLPYTSFIFHRCQFIIIPQNEQLVLELNVSSDILLNDIVSVKCFWREYASHLILTARNFTNIFMKDSKIHVIGYYRSNKIGQNFSIVCKADLMEDSVVLTKYLNVYSNEKGLLWSSNVVLNNLWSSLCGVFSFILLSTFLILGLIEIIGYISKY